MFRVGSTLYRGVVGVLALIPVRAGAVAEELVAGSIGVTAPLAPLSPPELPSLPPELLRELRALRPPGERPRWGGPPALLGLAPGVSVAARALASSFSS